MRALMIVCAALGLLMSSDLNADSVQATLDRLAAMDANEQQAWLLNLEARAIRAASKTLDPTEAARREVQIREMLHRELVTWPVLGELLADTLQREAALANPQPAERPATKQSHTVHKPVVTETPSSNAVQVNVDELAARIAGSNLGLRTLESELNDKGTWDAARLEPLADRLRFLVMRYNDLNLFRDLAPADQRAAVGQLEQPRAAISSLGARIFEARRLAESDEFQGSDAERQAELRRLEALSRQLAALDGGK